MKTYVAIIIEKYSEKFWPEAPCFECEDIKEARRKAREYARGIPAREGEKWVVVEVYKHII